MIECKANYKTEVEARDGTVVLFHNGPLTADEKDVFKNFTRKEIEDIFLNEKFVKNS